MNSPQVTLVINPVKVVITFCQACGYLPSFKASPALAAYFILFSEETQMRVIDLLKVAAWQWNGQWTEPAA